MGNYRAHLSPAHSSRTDINANVKNPIRKTNQQLQQGPVLVKIAGSVFVNTEALD